MGFNVRYVTSVNEIEELIKEKGRPWFYESLKKSDSLRGNVDAIDYIEHFINNYNNGNLESNQVNESPKA
jgi:hypothetical protein